MAWRITDLVVRGEVDNRNKGRVTGKIWLKGHPEPVILDLEGNPWRDLAGLSFRFVNPNSESGSLQGFSFLQNGSVGDITASRKVKVPDCTREELTEHLRSKTPFPYYWGNALYLEWYSSLNGRVVIESAAFKLEVTSAPAWSMNPEEEVQQRMENEEKIMGFINQLTEMASVQEPDVFEYPMSDIEREADEESARMDLLIERINRRIMDEDLDYRAFDRIMEEERSRLRQERGEPEPLPPTPQELEERAQRIDELNADSIEALEVMESESWKLSEREQNPLVEQCSGSSIRLRREAIATGWISETTNDEHPLNKIIHGIMFAGPKLAGAFCLLDHDFDESVGQLLLGSALVSFKKAREFLMEAFTALDHADKTSLASESWRQTARSATDQILQEVNRNIAEIRARLE